MSNNIKNTINQSLEMTDKLHQALSSILKSTNIPATTPVQSFQPKIQPFTENIEHTQPKFTHSRNMSDNIRNIQLNGSLHSFYGDPQIEKTLLIEQNELLKAQNMELKRKTKQLRQKIRDHKKYIQFLENYNDNLKKQVILWMNRPDKDRFYDQQAINRDQYFQMKQRIDQVPSYHLQVNQPFNPKHPKINRDDTQEQDSTIIEPKNYNQIMANAKHNRNRSDIIINKKDKECTSCNYLKIKDEIRKNPQHRNGKTKKKKLCGCHKRYLEKSHF